MPRRPQLPPKDRAARSRLIKLLAAALFIVTGDSVEKAVLRVSQSRGVPVPETENQREWLNRIASNLHGENQHPDSGLTHASLDFSRQ